MKKSPVISKQCVACGTCVKVCPAGAIKIHRGLYALADLDKCLGCGVCAKACPASVIAMEAVS
ncbi:MAG: 4Fe-4S binding protein [Bacillota bacterium]|nr:4Fe-4S binding protein [Bacillota bacterium]